MSTDNTTSFVLIDWFDVGKMGCGQLFRNAFSMSTDLKIHSWVRRILDVGGYNETCGHSLYQALGVNTCVVAEIGIGTR